MATNVTMSIGPSGQPPTTTYSHTAGLVTLSERFETVRSLLEVKSIVSVITVFRNACILGGPPATVGASADYDFRLRVTDAEPTIYECRFRCDASPGPMNLTADIDKASRICTFHERPERTITWSDFEDFLRWMTAVYEAMRRG